MTDVCESESPKPWPEEAERQIERDARETGADMAISTTSGRRMSWLPSDVAPAGHQPVYQSGHSPLKHLYIVDLKLNDALSGGLLGVGVRMVRTGKHLKRDCYVN